MDAEDEENEHQTAFSWNRIRKQQNITRVRNKNGEYTNYINKKIKS